MAQAQLQSSVDNLCSLDQDSLTTVLQSVLNARPEVAPAVVAFAVPDLTYPPSRALSENRQNGHVKSFNESGGFGFIACPELFSVFGGDVFFHRSQLGNFGVNDPVNFAVTLSKDGKPQAYDIQNANAKGKGKACGGVAAAGNFKGAAAMGGKGGWVDYGAANGFKGNGIKGDGKFNKGKGKGTWELKKGQGEVPDDAEMLGVFTGTVKSFSFMKGYGFVECEELKSLYGNDVFVQGDDIGSFEQGAAVGFTAFLNKFGKPQAVSLEADPNAIQEPEQSAAKRMRV